MTAWRNPRLIGGVVLAVLVLLGAVLLLARRGPDSTPDAATGGVDAPPVAVAPSPDPAEAARKEEEERRRQEEEAARLAREEEERQAAEAYRIARAEDEAYAETMMARWGRGRLLLGLPSINVTASVSQLGFERDGRTPAIPYTAWGVGWYEFTDFPGTPGNAVLSGHVDYLTGEPAVFGRLKDVQIGDPLYMVLADGTPVVYIVERHEWVQPHTADVGEIFGITEQEAVTIITCGGQWDARARDYSHRLLVRAFRVR
jgi:LPXTG-site transpeptidase (sortase) family protein